MRVLLSLTHKLLSLQMLEKKYLLYISSSLTIGYIQFKRAMATYINQSLYTPQTFPCQGEEDQV